MTFIAPSATQRTLNVRFGVKNKEELLAKARKETLAYLEKEGKNVKDTWFYRVLLKAMDVCFILNGDLNVVENGDSYPTVHANTRRAYISMVCLLKSKKLINGKKLTMLINGLYVPDHIVIYGEEFDTVDHIDHLGENTEPNVTVLKVLLERGHIDQNVFDACYETALHNDSLYKVCDRMEKRNVNTSEEIEKEI